jgi:hypothetical protein
MQIRPIVITLVLLNMAFGPEPVRAGEVIAPSPLQQRSESFTIALAGPVKEATPLFGPMRETEWAPDWKPRFLHPANGAQHAGVVFTTTGANGDERIWLLANYDVDLGQVDYAVFTPGLVVNEIKIRVGADGERHCKATITYRRSALTVAGNAEVARLDSHWAEEQQNEWERSINAVLTRR